MWCVGRYGGRGMSMNDPLLNQSVDVEGP
eukprot:COSAG02_NODE_30072_length_557_cov_3.192140_1_plen_28_part_01